MMFKTSDNTRVTGQAAPHRFQPQHVDGRRGARRRDDESLLGGLAHAGTGHHVGGNFQPSRPPGPADGDAWIVGQTRMMKDLNRNHQRLDNDKLQELLVQLDRFCAGKGCAKRIRATSSLRQELLKLLQTAAYTRRLRLDPTSTRILLSMARPEFFGDDSALLMSLLGPFLHEVDWAASMSMKPEVRKSFSGLLRNVAAHSRQVAPFIAAITQALERSGSIAADRIYASTMSPPKVTLTVLHFSRKMREQGLDADAVGRLAAALFRVAGFDFSEQAWKAGSYGPMDLECGKKRLTSQDVYAIGGWEWMADRTRVLSMAFEEFKEKQAYVLMHAQARNEEEARWVALAATNAGLYWDWDGKEKQVYVRKTAQKPVNVCGVRQLNRFSRAFSGGETIVA